MVYSIRWIWRQTVRCSIPIRGRDNTHTNRQSTEYSNILEDAVDTAQFKTNQQLTVV